MRMVDRGFVWSARFGIFLLVALCGLVATGWLAIQSAQKADLEARAALVASSGLALQNGAPRDAVMFALSAMSEREDDLFSNILANDDPAQSSAARRALSAALPNMRTPLRMDDLGRTTASWADDRAVCVLAGSQRLGLVLRAIGPGACGGVGDPDVADIRRLELAPDRAVFAFARADGSIEVRNRAGAVLSKTPAHAAMASDVAFSADGRFLAITRLGNHPAARIEVSSARLDPLPISARSIVFRDDGTVVLGQRDGRLAVLGAAQESPRIIKAHRGEVTRIVRLSDAPGLATIGSDGVIRIWSGSLDQQRAIETGHELESLAVDAGANRLAVGTFDGKVLIYDRTGHLIVRLDTGRGPVLSVQFSADGSRLLAGTVRGGIVYDISDQLGGDLPGIACQVLIQSQDGHPYRDAYDKVCPADRSPVSVPPIWAVR